MTLVRLAKPGFAGDQVGKYFAGEMADPGALRRGLQDRVPGRVVDRDSQMQDIAACGGSFRLPDRIGNAGGQAVATSDHGQTNAVADQAFDFVGQIEPQQSHQG